MMHARPIQITIALLLAFGSPTLANIVDGSTIQSSDKGKDVMDKAEQGNLRSPSNQLTMESKQRNLLDQITAESHQENTANFFDVQRRKLFSWATVVKFALHPPHPPHHSHSGSSSGGSSSGGSSSGGSSSGGSSSRSGDSSGNSSGNNSGGNNVANSINSDNGRSGTSSSSGSASEFEEERSDLSTGGRFTSFSTSTASIAMFVIAAAAAGAAIGAVVLGKRQKSSRKAHPLQGGINRRITLFSNFANNSVNVERPERLVEMTSTGKESDYVRA